MIFRSKTVFQTTDDVGPGANAFTIDKPSGVADGDLLIIAVYTQEELPFHNVTASPNASAGVWTSIDGFNIGDPSASDPRGFFQVMMKVASSEPATWSFDTASGGSPPLSSFGVVWACLAYRDGSDAALLDGDHATVLGDGPYTTPGLTPGGSWDPVTGATLDTNGSADYGGAGLYAIESQGDLLVFLMGAQAFGGTTETSSWVAPSDYHKIVDENQSPGAPLSGIAIAVKFIPGDVTPPEGQGVSLDGVTIRG